MTKNTNMQMAMFGPNLILAEPLPTDLREMGIAPEYCDTCGVTVLRSPNILCNCDENEMLAGDCAHAWVWTCHEILCSSCDEFQDGNCENCECCTYSCCECFHCEWCGDPVDESAMCKECVKGSSFVCEGCCKTTHIPREEQCECGCGMPAYSSYTNGGVIPGWQTRQGFVYPSNLSNARQEIQNETAEINPVQMMADFYLCDFILSNSHKAFGFATGGVNRGVFRSAKVLQDYIVARCAPTFSAYAFAAIGGELRYHPNVNSLPKNGRSSAWDTWEAMGRVNNRGEMLADAIALFGDDGAWESSFGGEAWESCAIVAHAYETGAIDARTFVDRTFSLQHNSGSFLNKVEWQGFESCGYSDISAMTCIGNAHASNPIDFVVLFKYASVEVLDMFANLTIAEIDRGDSEFAREELSRIHQCLSHVARRNQVKDDPNYTFHLYANPSDIYDADFAAERIADVLAGTNTDPYWIYWSQNYYG